MQFDFSKEIFGSNKKLEIPKEAKIIFVSDMFVEDYVGGAELTSQALIDSAPFPVYKIHSKDVNMDLLEQGQDRFWIFGNFANIDLSLLPTIIGNAFKYAVCEYDYKYCKYRSPEKHFSIENTQCDCSDSMHGKLISAFYYAAASLWWMSEKQRNIYFQMFPFLADKDNTVLSSVFDDKFFVRVKLLRDKYEKQERNGWIVLGSTSWVKGQDAAVAWCTENNKSHEIVWDLPYDQLLEKLAASEGFVYLPAGGDTCPRMVIEAKLLGCKLELNENVQHKNEEWFATDDMNDTEAYLFLSRSRFWSAIKQNMAYAPKLSGYTTTYNCESQGYPFEQSIRSMLNFCDEVVVVDGGSTDETMATLASMAYPIDICPNAARDSITLVEDIRVMCSLVKASSGQFEFPEEFNGIKRDPKLRVIFIPRDWDHARFAVFDGAQKAEARKLCTGDFCWQQDSDEIVDITDVAKIRDLMHQFPTTMLILALPVIEYWGGADKVRFDVMPWKWRISRNDRRITHGIPIALRKIDADGNMFASPGTDGCDMIDAITGEPLPHGTFYTVDVDQVRYAAFTNPTARVNYNSWLNAVTANLPTVFHFSWWDLVRKIKTYQGYWGRHWKSLYDIEITDTPENNMMFDKAWKDVTDDDIVERAKLMNEKLGGWIWHNKWDGKTETPHITVNRTVPTSMIEWCQRKSG